MKKLIKYTAIAILLLFVFTFTNYKLISKANNDVLNKYDIVNGVFMNPFWLIKDVSEMFPKGKLREKSDIKFIIAHHDQIENVGNNRILDIYDYHHDNKKWSTIAYHYYIMPNGRIYRLHKDNEITPHCSAKNLESIGICLHGNFENDLPTMNQYFAYNILSLYLSEKYKAEIKFHKDFMDTQCPGVNFQPIYYKNILQWILEQKTI